MTDIKWDLIPAGLHPCYIMEDDNCVAEVYHTTDAELIVKAPEQAARVKLLESIITDALETVYNVSYDQYHRLHQQAFGKHNIPKKAT